MTPFAPPASQQPNTLKKSMPKRCPYPLCIREEDHDGDHKFGRPKLPAGELRLVQEFNCAAPSGSTYRGMHCDLHNDRVAEAFYQDSYCPCAKQFSVPAVSYQKVIAITAGRSRAKGGNAKYRSRE